MSICLAPFLHDLGECGCSVAQSAETLVDFAAWLLDGPDDAPQASARGADPQAQREQDRGHEPLTDGGRGAGDDHGEPGYDDENDDEVWHPDDLNADGSAPIPTVAGWPTTMTWSEYEDELRTRGARALDPAEEHGLWCPADCLCGFALPEDAAQHNPLLGHARAILDPKVAAMFLHADDADRMLYGDGALYRFILGGWHELEPGTPYEDGELVRAVCDHVQTQLEEWAIAAGLELAPPGWEHRPYVQRAKNLLIRIPPRSLKTVIVTIAASAWAWLRWPTMTIASYSSNPRVTADGSDKVRGLIRSDWYQATFRPTWRIREDRDSVSSIANTAGGARKARGISSRVTGEGFDWRIVDDPHDGDEVYSAAKRAAVNSKWEKALVNRFRDPRISIVTGVMQALHWDDWGERRIREGWPLLLIRMCYTPSWAGGKPKEVGVRIIEPDDIRVSPYGWVDWRTDVDEPVAVRWTEEVLAPLRAAAITWAAQYQQDPSPIDGGVVKSSDLMTYAELPSGIESWAITVDAAFKKNEGVKGSRVSVQVWCRKGTARFLVDNDTRGMDMDETVAAIKAMRAKYPRTKGTILIEPKANGIAIIAKLQKIWPGVIAVDPGSDSKLARLMACQSFFTGHCVYLPEFAPWLEAYKQEMTQFPNWPKDDQVDATVQLLLYWQLSSAATRARAGCSL